MSIFNSTGGCSSSSGGTVTVTTHASTHGASGSDPVTPAAIGAAPAAHGHSLASLGLTDVELTTRKGVAGGYAGLDASGRVPASQLPSYVDSVIEVANAAALPATGVSGKIYVTLNDNKQFRWGGSAYVQLVASPGSTDSVPEGSVNQYFTTARAAAAQVNADWNSTSGKSQILGKPTLGTAAAKDAPSSGNATAGQVVLGDDSRLTDARTPMPHTHPIAQVDGDYSKLVTIFRDMTLSAGDQAATGVGFNPRAIVFLSASYVPASGSGVSVGMFNGSTNGGVQSYDATWVFASNGHAVSLTLADGWSTADVVGTSGDGFTLNWQKNGSPTGVFKILAMCLR